MRPPARHHHLPARAVAAVLLAANPSSARADEGPWPPEQLAEVMDAALAERGFELDAAALWTAGGGLLRAAVRVGGCSASFISPDGLVATNHHCAYGAIQAVSTVAQDRLADGFVARSRDEELPAPGVTIQVIARIEDVSARFDALRTKHTDPVELAKAYDDLVESIVDDCERARPDHRCRVASFFGGRVHRLYDTFEIRDVRLVFAPPSSIGEYGGEIDNWHWPRHTGDVALLRAYVAPDGGGQPTGDTNVPYRPPQHLTVAPEGVEPGQTVAVLGYPGRTLRHVPAAEAAFYADVVYPLRQSFYADLLGRLHEHAARDPKVALAVASKIKSLENRRKNAAGMLDGLRRGAIVELRREEAARIEALAARKGPNYQAALRTLAGLVDERRAEYRLRFLLAQAGTVSNVLAVARDIVGFAADDGPAQSPDARARRRARIESAIDRRLRSFEPAVERALLGVWFSALENEPRAAEVLPASLRRPARIAGSVLTDPHRAKALLGRSRAELARLRDPALAVALALAAHRDTHEEDDLRRRGLRLAAMPLYSELVEQVRGRPFYPDANRTLRVSFATVRGYDPEDGLRALPQTTLSGAVTKHRDAPPFDLPDDVLAAAPTAPDTYWADPHLKDVPVCFLTDADTTGGNSGSAVIDGRGRLVGLNFDRVWENVVGDFAYDPRRSRNIVVDIRYVLWLLDDVYHATNLLEELGVAEHAGAARRPAPPPAKRPQTRDLSTKPDAETDRQRRSGCTCRAGEPLGGPAPLAVTMVLLYRCHPRRRRSRGRRT